MLVCGFEPPQALVNSTNAATASSEYERDGIPGHSHIRALM
ncbi:MAG: hypothetical protein ACYDHO_01545 [Gaiellaceae bacterium]